MTQLEKIKKLLEESVLFTEEQKKGWLSLLPKMNQAETDELFGILRDELVELKKEGFNLLEDEKLEQEILAESAPSTEHGASLASLKAAVSQPSNGSKAAFAQELKREVETVELRQPTKDELSPKIPQAPKPMPKLAQAPKSSMGDIATKFAPLPKELQVPMAPKHREIPVPTGGLRSLTDIRTVDDFKKIQTDHLRQGEIRAQIEIIRSKIISVAHANKLIPYYTVNAFEQSPLYKSYLAIGAALILDSNPDRTGAYEQASQKVAGEKLTLREFEAVADLRKQIEQL